jgi:hypothetical protein
VEVGSGAAGDASKKEGIIMTEKEETPSPSFHDFHVIEEKVKQVEERIAR